MVRFIESKPIMDLSSTSLTVAVKKIEAELGVNVPLRLVVSNGYDHATCVAYIFEARGRLDIPFEISHVLPPDAWFLADDKFRVMFFSEGVR